MYIGFRLATYRASQVLLDEGIVIIDGPAVQDPLLVRSWFCSDRASTRLPGAKGRFRHQVASGEIGRMLRRKFEKSLDAAGVLMGREVLPRQDAMYALRTEQGAMEQALPHTDWPKGVCAGFRKEEKPGSAIWAACADFELIGPHGETIIVKAGKIAVFQGEWLHCGGPHTSSCLRVHSFLRPLGSSLLAPVNVYKFTP